MKILKSCGSPSWGGIEIYILRTIEKLTELGNEVSLLCPPHSNIEKNAREKGIKAYPILKRGAGRFDSIVNLRKLLKENKFEVIHTHLSNDLWVIVPALRNSRHKTKLILSKCMASGVKKKDILHKQLYNRTDTIIAVSNFIKQNVLDTCPVNESKVDVVPDAIDLTRFNPALYDGKKIRNELGINESTIVVGMVGRMSPGKGHETLFATARMLMGTDYETKIRFLVIGGASFGEDKYEMNLMETVKKDHSEKMIIFKGFQNDVAHFLSAMDIFAFPSNEESFGGAALEAMAMNLPVVASDAGGVPDIVINNETGILIPRNDPKALSDALIKLVENTELRTKFGLNGRKRVEQHFEMTSNMKKFEKIYAY